MSWRREVRVVPRWTRRRTYSWGERTLGRIRICTFARYSWLRVRPNGADELSEILSTAAHVCTRGRSYWNWQQAAPIFFFFPPFAEWRPQCLFKTGFLIKSQRSRLGWRLHINCERSLNRILSNTILISTYSLALFSWCHIGVKSWIGLNIEGFFFVVHASLCVCVLPPTGEWDSANGSQSLAIINHLMYLFFLHYPPWPYFLFLYPTFVSLSARICVRAAGDLLEAGESWLKSKQKCLSADVYQGHRGCANSHYQRLRQLLSALASLDFYLSWQTKRSLSDTHPLQ